MKDKIPINDVIRDMTFHEIGWVQKSAEYYFHKEYLHEELGETMSCVTVAQVIKIVEDL